MAVNKQLDKFELATLGDLEQKLKEVGEILFTYEYDDDYSRHTSGLSDIEFAKLHIATKTISAVRFGILSKIREHKKSETGQS